MLEPRLAHCNAGMSWDWPLSREEKKSCVLRLYNKDVEAANLLLKTGQQVQQAEEQQDESKLEEIAYIDMELSSISDVENLPEEVRQPDPKEMPTPLRLVLCPRQQMRRQPLSQQPHTIENSARNASPEKIIPHMEQEMQLICKPSAVRSKSVAGPATRKRSKGARYSCGLTCW